MILHGIGEYWSLPTPDGREPIVQMIVSIDLEDDKIDWTVRWRFSDGSSPWRPLSRASYEFTSLVEDERIRGSGKPFAPGEAEWITAKSNDDPNWPDLLAQMLVELNVWDSPDDPVDDWPEELPRVAWGYKHADD